MCILLKGEMRGTDRISRGNKKCVSQMNNLWPSAIVGNSVGVDFSVIKTLDCNKYHRLQHPSKTTEVF